MRSDSTDVALAEIAADQPNAIAAGPFGSNLVSRDYVDSGTPVIRGQNLAGRWVAGEFVYVSDAKAAQLRSNTACPGDIVFTQRGTLGQVSIVPQGSYPSYIVSQSQMKMTVDARKADYRFVYYACSAPDFVAQVQNNAVAAGVPHINLGILRALRIPLPALTCQIKAVEVLSALDDRIDLLRQTNATLESIAQALFKSWFIDFDPVRAKAEGREPDGMDAATAALFPSEFEESALGAIPKGWAPACVGDLADVTDCLHSKKPDLLNEGRPYLQLNNIRDDGLLDVSHLAFVCDSDYAKWTSRIEVREGDCVVTNVGRVGAVAQIPPRFLAAMGRNMTAIRPRADKPFPTILIELLLSSWMRAEIERQTDVGTILNALNVRSIPKLRFVLAPNAVLVAAESVLRPLRAAMESNLARASQLAKIRDTLLPRLISGKLRLPEAQEQIDEVCA